MKDRKLTILIILIVTLSLVGIGIAFAAFSQTLTINGSAEVEASSWKVVFEGMTNISTIDAPTTTGTASEVTHPTIKNNSTEISTYSVSLKTPGDSITYNFKIHNKGDFAANLSSLTISGVNRPASPVTGSALVTDSSIATANAKTLSKIEYKLYYTIDNSLVGQNSARDCLEAGESANVSLKITFASSTSTNPNILPSTDLVLDNLGISSTYTQTTNDACPLEPGYAYSGIFENIDYAYYTYEGKSFMGTGVNNVIISENITSRAKWSSAVATECSDESEPVNYQCPEGTTPVFTDNPAAAAAIAYCTGCRLMTHEEVCLWAGASTSNCSADTPFKNKIIGLYNGSAGNWWLADSRNARLVWIVRSSGSIYNGGIVNTLNEVRPAVSISSTATMSGSGTKLDPYVIQ